MLALRRALIPVVKRAWSLDVVGLDQLPKEGPCLIVANHYSLLDGPLLSAILPYEVLFAVDTRQMEKWYVRLVTRLGRVTRIATDNPLSLRLLADELRAGGKVMIFPEGRMTRSGALMKMYDGAAVLWEKGGRPPILAAHIDGSQHTMFAYQGPRRVFAPVKIEFDKLRRVEMDPGLPAQKRRQLVMAEIRESLETAAFSCSERDRTLPQVLVDSMRNYGAGKAVIADSDRELSYRALLRGALALSRFAREAEGGNVGVLLPTTPAAAVALFAIQFARKSPVLLNFTAGEASILSACRTAEVRTIWTSHRFLDAAKLRDLQARIEEEGIKVVALEDVRERIGIGDKLSALFGSLFPGTAARKAAVDPAKTPAAILFTSGSEGEPKGVALSHRNVLTNCCQTLVHLEISPRDVLLHTLPVFHSFGLFALVLGIMSGVRIRMHPTPLATKLIAEIAYQEDATLFFSANAFLARYGKAAHPKDCASMRMVIAGAEKLAPETRALWAERFGVRILEGYGVTETAPVIAFNTPVENRAGSVGRPIPGLKIRLDPVEGIEEGGRLVVSGDNVMMGYLSPDKPGEIIPPEGGWHDTGDVAVVDEDGFLHIVGRLKRFAKIAGEMAPLGAIEGALAKLWPEEIHFVAAVPDKSRGEELVAVTTRENPDRDEALEHFKQSGLPALWAPRRFVVCADAPLLPTGKPDYRRVTEMARSG